jgi:fructose-bisphosphate aldolase / 2-amino-3,7-dideoxy-D-threo-hept-6-ulosonate synthase
MTGVGKKIRLARIMPSNRSVIVPIDHGIEAYYPELEDPSKLVREFVEAKADAILLRRGTLFKVQDIIAGKIGIVYRVTGATGTTADPSDQMLISSVAEALRDGADCLVYTITIGHPKENEMFRRFGVLSDEAHEYEIPLMGEIEPWSKSTENKAELLRQGTRSLCEEGADLMKCYFPEDLDYYKKIVRYSLVPVVAAGGAKMNSGREVLEFVKRVMDAGAIGTSIGRNIWQYKEPKKMIQAISKVVKEGASVDDALKAL